MENLLHIIWSQLGWPLVKLVFFVSLGLVVANFIEAMNWTRWMASVAAPIARLGHLNDISSASFSLAMVSGVSANTMLSEAYLQNKINKRELLLANLFNSLPTYFLHLPTVFFITAPFIKAAAFLYVGLTFLAACLRTSVILALGRLLLPARVLPKAEAVSQKKQAPDWRRAALKTWHRFRRRIRKIILFIVPIYIGIFFLNRFGAFAWLKQWLANNVSFLSWLDPQALGIVVFHVAAEFSAGLAAASALLASGSLGYRDVVLALLVGNVLSAPIRALRHQLPYYMGIFPPRLALELVVMSQFSRTGSIVAVICGYYFLSR